MQRQKLGGIHQKSISGIMKTFERNSWIDIPYSTRIEQCSGWDGK
jgi:hypothetical protein